uniref:Uncharacterized protein n=1 Tax=Mus musculus TaxID=10090 RepID=Q7TMK2_MOUSE|nr:Unknown (protein for MGC:68297) [Mus musculus]
MSLPSPRDGRTDGLHKVGSLRRPHRRTHRGTHTGHTRAPRPPRHTRHTRHTRQAGQAHASAGPAAPATQTRTSRRGQDVHPPRSRCMRHLPSPRWTDGRTHAISVHRSLPPPTVTSPTQADT